MNSKLLESHSIPIPPQLAGRLKQTLGREGNGFDEGAFLQQLHYWTLNSETTGWMVDGMKWVYNSLKAWQVQFPWMSEYGLRKAITNLKKLGLIQTAQHWISQYKRVMFYRIDYDRLNAFADNLCEQIAARRVESDPIDVRTAHTSRTESTSNTAFSEQQTVVVQEKSSGKERAAIPEVIPDQREDPQVPAGDPISAPSSGKQFKTQLPEFPELMEMVAQGLGLSPTSSLPSSLESAIQRFPDRVKPAISYLQYQQQRRTIENPMGYLYEAIASGWDLRVPEAIVPPGFVDWFDRLRAQGVVLAAMTIEGVHHTLHNRDGWVPTVKLMQQER